MQSAVLANNIIFLYPAVRFHPCPSHILSVIYCKQHCFSLSMGSWSVVYDTGRLCSSAGLWTNSSLDSQGFLKCRSGTVSSQAAEGWWNLRRHLEMIAFSVFLHLCFTLFIPTLTSGCVVKRPCPKPPSIEVEVLKEPLLHVRMCCSSTLFIL